MITNAEHRVVEVSLRRIVEGCDIALEMTFGKSGRSENRIVVTTTKVQRIYESGYTSRKVAGSIPDRIIGIFH